MLKASSITPVLDWDVRISSVGQATVVETAEAEFHFEGVESTKVINLFALFDGQMNIADAAERASLPTSAAVSLAQNLVEHRLATPATAAVSDFMLTGELVAKCRYLFPILKRRLFGHPLWSGLSEGTLSFTVFLGWLIETYHFIEGVSARLGHATAVCPDREIRDLFAQHYAEEWDHWRYFLEALEACGVPQERAMSTRPLASTQAVMNFTRMCARQDPLQYATCSGFLESTGGDRSTATEFYSKLQKAYTPDNPRAIQPLIDHLKLDEEYGHGSFLEKICATIDRISVARASRALGAAVEFVETLLMWSTEILRYYDQPSFTLRLGVQCYRPLAEASESSGGGAEK